MYVETKNSRVAQNNMRGATLSSALTSALRARPQRHGTSRIARGVVQCAAPRESPDAVSREMQLCYDVVERMGRGAVPRLGARSRGPSPLRRSERPRPRRCASHWTAQLGLVWARA